MTEAAPQPVDPCSTRPLPPCMMPAAGDREGGLLLAAARAETSVELIERARNGDNAALQRLFERYMPPLRRWASGRLPRWTRTLIDTDDLVQDALLATFRNFERFEPRRDGALHAYMRQVLRRRIIDELRRAHRHPDRASLGEDQPADNASPLEQAIGAEAIERYEQALSELSTGDREVVVARVELGMSYAEIAATVGKPSADAARMAVSRALVRLAGAFRS